MKKNPQSNPKLVAIRDRHGDELSLKTRDLVQGDRAVMRAATVREDLQAIRRRPLDAPMATRDAWENKSDYRLDDVSPSLGIWRIMITMMLMAISFIGGLAVGRMG